MATKHTKQMYVVISPKNEIIWGSLNPSEVECVGYVFGSFTLPDGYTVQPVTVTIELN